MAHTEFKDIMKLRKPELLKLAEEVIIENKQLKQKRTNTGIEDALHEILDKYDSIIWEYEKEKTKLDSRFGFLVEHRFFDDARICNIKHNAIKLITFDFKAMHNEIKSMLNKWES